MIVSGSQQGLDLLAKVLVDPGDRVLVETPTYLGALQAFSLFGPRFVAVASDAEGLLPDALDDAMRGAKFLYCLPNFQNPTGRLLPLDRRQALVERARALDLLILEDDPYGALSYDGETPPAIRTLAPERTVYMGSFSKVLAPGLRIGYVIAPPALRAKLVQAKQATDLHTATLSQQAVFEVVKNGFLDGHIPSIRALYRDQCEAMLAALARHMPEGVRWNRPRGGMEPAARRHVPVGGVAARHGCHRGAGAGGREQCRVRPRCAFLCGRPGVRVLAAGLRHRAAAAHRRRGGAFGTGDSRAGMSAAARSPHGLAGGWLGRRVVYGRCASPSQRTSQLSTGDRWRAGSLANTRSSDTSILCSLSSASEGNTGRSLISRSPRASPRRPGNPACGTRISRVQGSPGSIVTVSTPPGTGTSISPPISIRNALMGRSITRLRPWSA